MASQPGPVVHRILFAADTNTQTSTAQNNPLVTAQASTWTLSDRPPWTPPTNIKPTVPGARSTLSTPGSGLELTRPSYPAADATPIATSRYGHIRRRIGTTVTPPPRGKRPALLGAAMDCKSQLRSVLRRSHYILIHRPQPTVHRATVLPGGVARFGGLVLTPGARTIPDIPGKRLIVGVSMSRARCIHFRVHRGGQRVHRSLVIPSRLQDDRVTQGDLDKFRSHRLRGLG